jgi:hypothetical protein
MSEASNLNSRAAITDRRTAGLATWNGPIIVPLATAHWLMDAGDAFDGTLLPLLR